MAVLEESRANVYRCLDALLVIKLEEKELDDYKSSLVLMYSQECMDICLDIMRKKVKFYGLHSPGLSLEGFEKHQALLDGYAKVHESKISYYK
jgi:ribosomal protein S12 methylthiotransferase accessory factor